MRSKQSWCVMVLCAVVLAVLVSPAAAQNKHGTGVVPPNPSQGVLTVDWWQWALSQPIRTPAYTGPVSNPLFDATGVAAANGQPAKPLRGLPVFFIGGAIFAIDSAGNPIDPVTGLPFTGQVERTITVPAGKYLFFPVANVEYDNVGVDRANWSTVPQLVAGAKGYADLFTGLYASIDGVPVPDLEKYRQAQAPFAYVMPPADNIYQLFGLDIVGRQFPAASDGYWLLLYPLASGQHTIEFGSTPPFGGLQQAVTYHITVP